MFSRAAWRLGLGRVTVMVSPELTVARPDRRDCARRDRALDGDLPLRISAYSGVSATAWGIWRREHSTDRAARRDRSRDRHCLDGAVPS